VANTHSLPIPFFANLIWAESSFNAKVISRAGAQGIAQFMPKTAVIYGLENPFEPVHAINVSARFLVELRDQFGNLGLAAAAYNAGPRRVSNWLAKRGSLPRETQRYVRKITGRDVEQWIGEENVARAEIEPMPARAPCIEVAEAVLEQTRLARVNNLMRELAAAVPPPGETTPTRPNSAPASMIARGDRKASRVAKLKAPSKDMRGKPQMAQAKPAKVDVSASRKRNGEELIKSARQQSKKPNKQRPSKSMALASKSIPGTPPAAPEVVAPTKVAKASSKPGLRTNTERPQNRARRTRFAYSADFPLH
jgi:hypothetical protein